MYMKPTLANVVDFIRKWPKNTKPFSTKTLCSDFNMVCQTPATESQMDGLLSGLGDILHKYPHDWKKRLPPIKVVPNFVQV